ncbi:MAG: histidine phosphatase family protein [Pseudomonadota bacterium]
MPIEHPFYFLRHGETTWNAVGRTQGQLDAPLSELGERQALEAAEILKTHPIEQIVASPLSRARRTAEAAGAALGLDVAFDDELMEFHAGEWQGQPRGENIRAYFMREADPPGGETFQEFADRAWGAIRRAAALGPNTLIVCHGGLWYAMRDFAPIEPPLWPMPNALPIRVSPETSPWRADVLSEG